MDVVLTSALSKHERGQDQFGKTLKALLLFQQRSFVLSGQVARGKELWEDSRATCSGHRRRGLCCEA